MRWHPDENSSRYNDDGEPTRKKWNEFFLVDRRGITTHKISQMKKKWACFRVYPTCMMGELPEMAWELLELSPPVFFTKQEAKAWCELDLNSGGWQVSRLMLKEQAETAEVLAL
jgi:hypothetical protein